MILAQLLLELGVFLQRHLLVSLDTRLQDVDLEHSLVVVGDHLLVLGVAVPLSLVALLLARKSLVLFVQSTLNDGGALQQAVAQCAQALVARTLGLSGG